jgi:hypothetical protein
MQNCKLVASDLKTAPILEALANNLGMWSEITVRQDYPGSAHHDTKCIFARGPEAFTPDKFFFDLGSYDYPAMDRLADVLVPVLRPLLNDVLKVTELGRVLIVNLKAGGSVDEHIDEGTYADYFARFHVVISTNPYCYNITGGEPAHWAVGECWWFDHKKPHAATNQGETDRVHIIIDAVAPDYPMPQVPVSTDGAATVADIVGQA